jgi:hypothetical protein
MLISKEEYDKIVSECEEAVENECIGLTASLKEVLTYALVNRKMQELFNAKRTIT